MNELSRRDFIKTVGATVAGLTMSASQSVEAERYQRTKLLEIEKKLIRLETSLLYYRNVHNLLVGVQMADAFDGSQTKIVVPEKVQEEFFKNPMKKGLVVDFYTALRNEMDISSGKYVLGTKKSLKILERVVKEKDTKALKKMSLIGDPSWWFAAKGFIGSLGNETGWLLSFEKDYEELKKAQISFPELSTQPEEFRIEVYKYILQALSDRSQRFKDELADYMKDGKRSKMTQEEKRVLEASIADLNSHELSLVLSGAQIMDALYGSQTKVVVPSQLLDKFLKNPSRKGLIININEANQKMIESGNFVLATTKSLENIPELREQHPNAEKLRQLSVIGEMESALYLRNVLYDIGYKEPSRRVSVSKEDLREARNTFPEVTDKYVTPSFYAEVCTLIEKEASKRIKGLETGDLVSSDEASKEPTRIDQQAHLSSKAQPEEHEDSSTSYRVEVERVGNLKKDIVHTPSAKTEKLEKGLRCISTQTKTYEIAEWVIED